MAKYRNILMMLAGIVLSALGMALYYYSALGSDPVSLFIDGLHIWLGLSYGTVLNGFNAVVLAVVVLFARNEARIGLVVSLVFSGTLLDMWTFFLESIFENRTVFELSLIHI